MPSLSLHVIVVGGGLAGSSATQHDLFTRIVATWFCWTMDVSAVTTRRMSTLFGKHIPPRTAFMEAYSRATRFFACCSNMDQVSVVGFRATLRVGLGSRVAAEHFPIWQHLGMSRQQRNSAKATLRFLRYSRTSAEFATRSKFGSLLPSCFDSRHFHFTCVSFVFARKLSHMFCTSASRFLKIKDVFVAGNGSSSAMVVDLSQSRNSR